MPKDPKKGDGYPKEEGLRMPENKERSFKSREYETFLEEEREQKKLSIYEKMCNISENIIVVEPDEEKKKEIERSINMTYMNITPAGAYSFAILFGTAIFVISIMLMILGIASMVFGILMFVLGAVSIYLLSEYPNSQARLFRVKAADQIMLAIIYMVIYMRTSPNLEGAIKFTAKHLGEPLSMDFKKLLWDVETGNYISMREALGDYLEKWEDNKAFVESVQIIQDSMQQTGEKRKRMLDEAINTMMTGSREMMKNYSNKLELPVLVIHALGIMLPIMVLIMFPIIMLMLEETIRPAFLIIGYNIVLPLIIYLTGKRTLEYRPMGFSEPDISKHPDHIPSGMINIGGKEIKIWPISVLLSVPVILIGIYLVNFYGGGDISTQLYTSLFITLGIALGPSTYFYLDSSAKLKLRKEVKDIEDEFSESLFSLGNILNLGKPMERALEETAVKNKDMDISNMFEIVVNNIKKGGMNIRRAFFDNKYGAVWHYPSNLIISVMKIVMDAAEKGSDVVSRSTISISKYLQQLDEIEEDLKNMLSSETTSMQFLGTFLGPFVAGVSVAMAAIMISIFHGVGGSLDALAGPRTSPGVGGIGGMGLNEGLVGGWGSAENMIPIPWIQVVVGLYAIQTSYLLSMLTSGIENGPGDEIKKRRNAAIMILIGVVVYGLSIAVVWEIFGGQISGLLSATIN